jgi:hypothetical protein
VSLVPREPRDPERHALDELVADVPELRPAWEEHLADNGEALPHVFMGDVARFAKGVGDGGDEALRARLAVALEKLAASEHEGVVNLIHVSFVEWFVWGDPDEQRAFAVLKKSFGPSMLQRVQEFEDWSSRVEQDIDKHGFPAGPEADR